MDIVVCSHAMKQWPVAGCYCMEHRKSLKFRFICLGACSSWLAFQLPHHIVRYPLHALTNGWTCLHSSVKHTWPSFCSLPNKLPLLSHPVGVGGWVEQFAQKLLAVDRVRDEPVASQSKIFYTARSLYTCGVHCNHDDFRPYLLDISSSFCVWRYGLRENECIS